MYIMTNHLKPPALRANGFDLGTYFYVHFSNSSETLQHTAKSLLKMTDVWAKHTNTAGPYCSKDTEAGQAEVPQHSQKEFSSFICIYLTIATLFLRRLGLSFVLVPLFLYLF